MVDDNGRTIWIATTCVVLTAGVFVLDLLAPLGFVIWLLYLVPIGLSSWLPAQRVPLAVAGLATTLSVAGFFLSPPGMAPSLAVWNRTLGVTALWIVAGLFVHRKQAEVQLKEQALQHELIFSALPIALYRLRASGDLPRTWISRNIRDVSGFPAERFVDAPQFWASRLHPEDRERVCAAFGAIGEVGKVQTEYRWRHADGAYRWFLDWATLILGRSDNPREFIGVWKDITERKHNERALQESEERYRSVVEEQTEIISRIRADGTFLFVNEAYCRFFGKSSHELIGGSWEPVAHPEDLPSIRAQLLTLSPSNPVVTIENRVWTDTGQVHWMQFVNRGTFGSNGGLVEIQSVGRDITERKRAEIERDRLAKRLVDLQEKERRALARDLHDEVGQTLTAIKLTLQHAQQAPQRTFAPALVLDCIASADRVLRQIRDLSLMLHPATLEDLGLAYAVRWLAMHHAERTHVPVEASVDPSLPRQNPDLEIACFRIAQEALTNIMRHAQASQVWISLHARDGRLELRIRDNGVGFVPSTVCADEFRKPSVGLLSMQERAYLLGGELQVTSVPGEGTEVRAVLPMSASAPPGRSSSEAS